MNKPCEACGSNRWKTKHKRLIAMFGSEYTCRNCGFNRKQKYIDKIN